MQILFRMGSKFLISVISWHPDDYAVYVLWPVTCDLWSATCDLWHATCDPWPVTWGLYPPVGCLYFRGCEEISGHSKRSVPTERMARYRCEKFAFKPSRSCRTSRRIRKMFNLPIFCGGERAAKQSESLCFQLLIYLLTSIFQHQITKAKAQGISCVSLHDLEEVKQNTFQLVFSSAERAMEKDFRQNGLKSANHNLMAWRREGSKVTLVAAIGGFRSDLSITRKTGGNFGNISVGVLFSKVAYQRKQWQTKYDIQVVF